MGRAMAMNLCGGDLQLTVYDTNDRHFAAFQAAGASCAPSLGVCAESEVVCLCLPSSAIVEAVLYGEDGLMAKLKEGQTVIDFSTITHASTVRIAADLRERGVHFMDAPVSGMQSRAEDGTLTVMCGGEQEVFDRMSSLFERVGNKVLYMGGHGSGQLTKLINQLLFDINAAALAEILPMAVKMGLDPEKIGEVVNSGTGRSYASEFFIPRNLKGVFDEGYPMREAYKDLVSAAELGAKHAIPMPVLAAATATYQMALLRGHGHLAKGAMLKVYEELLGVEYRS